MKRTKSMSPAKPVKSLVLLIPCLYFAIATPLFADETLEISKKIERFEQGIAAKNTAMAMQPFKPDAIWQGMGTYPHVEESLIEIFDYYKSIRLSRSKLEFSPDDDRWMSSADYRLQGVTQQGQAVDLPVSFFFLWENTANGWQIIAINPVMLVPVDGSVEDDLKKIDPAAGASQSSAAASSRPPVADSHVYAYDYSGWNKANWGAYNRLGAGWHPTGGEKRAFLRFDLAGVDPARVKTATLRLFHYHTGGSHGLALDIYRVTEPWTEGTGTYQASTAAAPGELCWIHQPSLDSFRIAQFQPGPGVDKWVEVDVSPLVQRWLSGTPNHGLAIKAQEPLGLSTPHAEYGFYSREADPDKRPVLVLSDGLASPPPAPDAPSNFDQALGLLCASDEDFVRSLYHCITHREPSAQEVQEQVGLLQNGTPRQHMIAYFFASPGYVNQNHDGVRFMTDACQAIYARPPTAAELQAWPRTDRRTIVNEMLKSPPHLAATKDCEVLWRKTPAGDPPAVEPDKTGWKTSHTGPHGSICPKADQWSTSGGGFLVMSGSHRFDKHWQRLPGSSPEGPYYMNGEDTTSPPRHSQAEIMPHVKVKQGTLVIRGPGALAYFYRRKSPSPYVSLSDAGSEQRFHPQAGGDQVMYQTRNWVFKDGRWEGGWTGEWRGNVNDLHGDRPMSGWVPAGQVKTLDVFVEQGWFFVNGIAGFGAPSEIEYELWFFPREGGGVKIAK
ncbi:MAG: DNRLRE domain-containing protein [Kiritimatiellia bacterium]